MHYPCVRGGDEILLWHALVMSKLLPCVELLLHFLHALPLCRISCMIYRNYFTYYFLRPSQLSQPFLPFTTQHNPPKHFFLSHFFFHKHISKLWHPPRSTKFVFI